MESLKGRYEKIQKEIQEVVLREKRDPATVTLVAVSKTKPFSDIEALYRLGHRDFGENYPQELLEKATLAKERGLTEIRWHFIGHLQTNKVKMILPFLHLLHSVDSERLAREISKRAEKPVHCLLNINIDSEESKEGFQISDFETAFKNISTLQNLDIQGLMCIPDPNRKGQMSEAFRKLVTLGKSLFTSEKKPLFSMGMTADFDQAIQEGSHFIRVGTAIFGERQYKI